MTKKRIKTKKPKKPARSKTKATTSTSEANDYEDRLRRRLSILKKEFEAGTIHINPDLKVIESLKAVRYAKDGTIDLSTVDGLVRSLALGVEAFHDRREIKDKTSLNEIQSTYFDFLERQFGQFFKIMTTRSLSPHQAAIALSSSEEPRKELLLAFPDFVGAIKQFWESAEAPTQFHLEDAPSLKAVFGGDLFPSYDESIASKAGVYADTIILPDPFLRSEWAFTRWNDQRCAYYLVKHALNALQYKSLVDANLNVPIIAILPTGPNNEERKYFARLAEGDAVAHAEHLFGRKFDSFNEVRQFASQLNTLDAALTEIKDGSRVLFETSVDRNPKLQLENAINGQEAELLGFNHPGSILAAQSIGRMSVANELLFKAAQLNGVPIIDAPTSWEYFAWKLQYDAERTEHAQRLSNLHVLRGLQSLAAGEMQWLGKVPHGALIEMRKQGALEEIRSVLGAGISELVSARPLNFYRTADKIFDNINTAFDLHKEKIKELQAKRMRFIGKDIGTWLVVGTLEVAAAATGHPIFGLSAVAANQLIDAPKLYELPKSVKELAQNAKQINRSPLGMLFAYAPKR